MNQIATPEGYTIEIGNHWKKNQRHAPNNSLGLRLNSGNSYATVPGNLGLNLTFGG